mmetsp:Transcript_53335/g.117099  ORF Transcript_53335/g.117099 Transcript_53335/m.117099 type:complete len:501 (-) Transcript_53335:63-1565(-)|eukprot:CAMPEP_0204319556 /NCGR_PEP_ID=MMETSP0469-20131031/7164_1 /ASSEMBLY_ACC=CAM_ASM_000384 /TAXON_ID=2969 /ORGANISM="Oxyrrhis marina" /LENGTH=500 /DNA_ID=CAMNT_0051300745 /DNA_START=22 /DNA_END=1524 /DNA_ORIENTATION=+
MSARDINDGRVSISLEPMGDGAVPLLEERRAALSESFLEVEEPVEAPVQDPWMMFWRENGFWVFFFLVCATSVAIVAVKIAQGRPSAEVSQTVEILSIPIVSTIFTWCHIWLAVQMCFYPVEFFGCCKIGNTGLGLGWQGIVPRKASKMAEKSCELMVGRLVKMEEIIDRFTFDEFFSTLGQAMAQCQANVNEKVAAKHIPKLWAVLPQSVKEEMLRKAMEATQASFEPMRQDIRGNIESILNVKEMAVTRMVAHPELLIHMFKQVGRKEFSFIMRCGAQMGLALGFAQTGLWAATRGCSWCSWVLLPVSGLIIGNLTNWVAIKMIFSPVHPHRFCGGRVNFQGVFLKRQPEVAKELARLITDTVVNAERMLEYLVASPGYEKALDIFNKHIASTLDDLAGFARELIPVAMGKDQWTELKKDVVQALLEELPQHSDLFSRFADQVLQIENTLAVRLAKLPPDEFEQMLHPVFQEDEWLLILLGGVLGVIVGLFQAAVLGQ